MQLPFSLFKTAPSVCTNIHFPGLFIVVDGADGCGKSTLVHALTQFFEKHHFPVVQTREPGGSRFGEELRSLLFSNVIHPDTQLLAMFAARLEHVETRIIPALLEGKIVISDRFIGSSYAYQVRGSGANEALFYQLKTHIDDKVRPDATLFLNASYETLIKRTSNRSALMHGPFESRLQANPEFYEAVLEGFMECIDQDPDQYHTINAEDTEQMVFENVLKAINEVVIRRRSQTDTPSSLIQSLESTIDSMFASFQSLR